MISKLFRRGDNEVAEDPVCHMQVKVASPAGGTFEHDGATYYFCGASCRNAFSRNPQSFLGEGAETGHMHGSGHEAQAPSMIADPTNWGFELSVPADVTGVVDVEYACACGCRPGARYTLGSDESGWEHCCCGRVHFAGEQAEPQIRAYMAQRAETDMDADVGPYSYLSAAVTAPSGQRIPVAYAQPAAPRK